MQVALHSVLREGQEAAYEREHARIWPEMLAALQRAGIREWMIWRSGRNLFHLVDTDDLAASFAALGRDPIDARWQAHMAAYVDHFEEDPDAAGIGLRRVWTMSEQAG